MFLYRDDSKSHMIQPLIGKKRVDIEGILKIRIRGDELQDFYHSDGQP